MVCDKELQMSDSNWAEYNSCSTQTANFLNALDPHCGWPVSQDRSGSMENNPCFAGDQMVWKIIDGQMLSLSTLINRAEAKMRRQNHDKTINLWSEYKGQASHQFSRADRTRFLGFVAFLTSLQ